MSSFASSRDAWIVVDALQCHAAVALSREPAGAQMFCQHVPHRASLLRVDRGPARNLVGLAGGHHPAAVELQIGNPLSEGFSRRASIGETADAGHIAAL